MPEFPFIYTLVRTSSLENLSMTRHHDHVRSRHKTFSFSLATAIAEWMGSIPLATCQPSFSPHHPAVDSKKYGRIDRLCYLNPFVYFQVMIKSLSSVVPCSNPISQVTTAYPHMVVSSLIAPDWFIQHIYVFQKESMHLPGSLLECTYEVNDQVACVLAWLNRA